MYSLIYNPTIDQYQVIPVKATGKARKQGCVVHMEGYTKKQCEDQMYHLMETRR